MSQPQKKSTRREYEKSGLYPKHGKPFRVLALLGVIAGVIAALALISAGIDFFIDY